jgi:hypothetical protein
MHFSFVLRSLFPNNATIYFLRILNLKKYIKILLMVVFMY